MGFTTFPLLLAICLIFGVSGNGDDSLPFPIVHRPGAILVKGPEVSASVGMYRLFIDLPTYDYAAELTALATFEQTTDSSLAILNSLHENLSTPTLSSGSKLKDRLIRLFHDLSSRIIQALNEFKSKQSQLKNLQNLAVHNSSLGASHDPASEDQMNKSKRDLADYFGLVSTGEMAELNHWVTQIQTSETKLAHSAEQQLSYLDRTVQRLNQQEDRINQLAAIDIQWGKTIQLLQQSDANSPEYFELILTYIQGLAAVAYYEGGVRQRIERDIHNLILLQSHQLPPDLISAHEFRHILTEARPLMPPGFSFTEHVDELVTSMARLPVVLLRDPQNDRLCAKITVPAYLSSDAFRLWRVVPTPLQNPKLPGIQELFDLPSDLVAVSKNQFFSLAHHDLFDCANYSPIPNVMEQTHLCVTPPVIITYSEQGTISSCAAALYFETDSVVPKACKTRIRVAPGPLFSRLVRNIWIYEPTEPSILRFVCPSQQYPSINLHSDGGRLIIPPGCSGITGQMQIPPFTSANFHVSLPNETHLTFQQVNSSFWIHNLTLPSSDPSASLLSRVKSALYNSSHLSMPLETFKVTLHDITTELNQDAVTHFLHHNSAAPHAGTVVTVLILAVVSVSTCCLLKCCWRRYRNSRRHNPSPQAMPMVTFAPPANALITPLTRSPGSPIRDISPPLPENPCRVVARRSRSRSRRAPQPS